VTWIFDQVEELQGASCVVCRLASRTSNRGGLKYQNQNQPDARSSIDINQGRRVMLLRLRRIAVLLAPTAALAAASISTDASAHALLLGALGGGLFGGHGFGGGAFGHGFYNRYNGFNGYGGGYNGYGGGYNGYGGGYNGYSGYGGYNGYGYNGYAGYGGYNGYGGYGGPGYAWGLSDYGYGYGYGGGCDCEGW
jgi:hypothetical protein